MQQLRADVLLVRNIEALLSARGIDRKALAMWCGHGSAWISKILNGERGIAVHDLGKVADFFGLTVAQLFQHGISHLTERRKGERRNIKDRRQQQDRRQPRELNRVHRDVRPFPTRQNA